MIGARSGFTKSVKELAPRSTLVYFHEILPSSGRRISPFTPTITIKDCYKNNKHTLKGQRKFYFQFMSPHVLKYSAKSEINFFCVKKLFGLIGFLYTVLGLFYFITIYLIKTK